jgi:hypothetical protein
VDEIWNKLLELYNKGGDGVVFETLYTSLPDSKIYLVHLFCNVDIYRSSHLKYRLNVSLIPIDLSEQTSAADDAAVNEDATFATTEAAVHEDGSAEPPPGFFIEEVPPEQDQEPEPAPPQGVGTKVGSNSPAAKDNPESNKHADDEGATFVAPLLRAGTDNYGTTPAADDSDSNKNADDEVATLVAEDNSDKSGAKDDGSKAEKPTEIELDGGTEDDTSTKNDGRKSEKSTDTPKIDSDTNVHVSDDATQVPSEMLDKLRQLRIVVEKFSGPPGKLDEYSFTVPQENIMAATILIAEVKTTIDDLTKKVATDALSKVAMEARAIRCIAFFQIGYYKLATEECMDVLETPLNDDALATKVRKCLCWSSLGNGAGSSHSYTNAWNALNDSESVSDLRAMNAVNNLSKIVSKAVNGLNRGGLLAPTKLALEKALKTADDFLDILPGSTIMQVNKVNFLSRLGLWSKLRAYLEDVAGKTSNLVSIFTGDLESKSPFPTPGQRFLEGAHFVVQNLLDVRLTMSYIRSLVFSNQLDVAKSLLLDVSGLNLSADEEVQKYWNLWRAQEISNVVMVEDRLAEVLKATKFSSYELRKCAHIEWGAIFPNDSPTAQGELLAIFRADFLDLVVG